MTTDSSPVILPAARLIQAQPLFEGLDQQAVDALIRRGEVLDFAPGEILIREDANNDRLFLIIEGFASVNSSGTAIGRLAAGELAGEISSAKISPPIATVRAETSLQAISFPASLIADIAGRDTDFARRLRQIAFRRISGQPASR